MFFYLLSLSATNYILAYDPNRNPYIARETFQEGCHLLLYDQLLQFTSKFETEEEFINLVMIILVYMRKQKNDKKSEISADEIKPLLVASITAKFGLGKVSISSLELLADFDEDLVTHFHSLYEHGIYNIKPSVYKEIKDYTPVDYLINRSMAFIGLAYGTCLYQLTLFQVTHNRWHFKDPCLFIEVIEKYVNIEDAVKKIISNKHHDYTDYKSSLEYLLCEAHYYKKAETYFLDCKPYKNIIVSVYSNTELFYALIRNSRYKVGVFTIPLTIKSVLSHFTNLKRLDGMYKDLLGKKIDMNFISINRPFIKYELFFIFTIVNDYNNLTSFKHNIYRLRDANEWINTFVDLALQA